MGWVQAFGRLKKKIAAIVDIRKKYSIWSSKSLRDLSRSFPSLIFFQTLLSRMYLRKFVNTLKHENNGENILLIYIYIKTLIINAKLQSYFLKSTLINTNNGSSDFLIVLNYCEFYLRQFRLQYFIQKGLERSVF